MCAAISQKLLRNSLWMVMSHWASWEVPTKELWCAGRVCRCLGRFSWTNGISISIVNQSVALQHCALVGINVID